jgi:hypothetical protein
MRPMPTAQPSSAERPSPERPERHVLACAVGVWWVRRLLEAARRRRAWAEDPAVGEELGPSFIVPS